MGARSAAGSGAAQGCGERFFRAMFLQCSRFQDKAEAGAPQQPLACLSVAPLLPRYSLAFPCTGHSRRVRPLGFAELKIVNRSH